MRLRTLLIITMLTACHLILQGQALTNAALPTTQGANRASETTLNGPGQSGARAELSASLPDDPGQEILPMAEPEPTPARGVPVEWEAERQTRVGNTWTLTGGVVVHYRDYILRADRVVYDQSTTELDAEGNLEVAGGPSDVLIYADYGDMRLNMHTARYFGVHGTQGVHTLGNTKVYSTTTPFSFTGRVVLETSEGNYQIIDGTMTNCRLPRPDWRIISRTIKVQDGKASTSNARFKLFNVPIFYFPYLHHPVDEGGRESGFLIPVISTGSSIKGYTFGEQYYYVINRSMDATVGAEYFSKRGWAPNGDFRYKGRGQDHLAVRWTALLDRGTKLPITAGSKTMVLTNQGGVDINAQGRADINSETRVAGKIEYLSSYVYRLVFNDDYWQAVSSEVQSNVSITNSHRGFVTSVALDRFQTFAGTSGTTVTDTSSVNHNQARILHLPTVRFDVLDRPLGATPLYFGMGSSLGYMTRSDPGEPIAPGGPLGNSFHARNVGRFDLYPHVVLPLAAGGWNLVAEAATRETTYSISQN